MDTYDEIETDQDRIELFNLIQTICHLQDDEKIRHVRNGNG